MIPSRRPPIREKHHRLPRGCYRGQVTVAFTACVDGGSPLFTDAQVVGSFTERLQTAVEKHQCVVFIYCFMPEHQHLIVHGNSPQADTWRAMVDYKQLTGFWLGRHRPDVKWQKDFYDHIIRADEDLGRKFATWLTTRCAGDWSNTGTTISSRARSELTWPPSWRTPPCCNFR